MYSIGTVQLYVIIDITLLENAGRCAMKVMEQALSGGAQMFQMRHKGVPEGLFFTEAKYLVPIAKKAGVPFIINDSISVAMACGADGVHLGEDDLPVESARKLAGRDFIIGATARNVAKAIECERDGADYVGYGAIFQTSTKTDAQSGSLDELKKILDAVKISVFPLGGINENNILKIVQIGCNRVCVASGIILSDDPKNSARKIYLTLTSYKDSGCNI